MLGVATSEHMITIAYHFHSRSRHHHTDNLGTSLEVDLLGFMKDTL